MAQRGFYDHGRYPFVLDVLFPMESTPVGFGYVDVMKGAQGAIDRLNQAVLKNAALSARMRWFIRSDGAVNEEEYADFTRDFVHVQGNSLGEDSIRQIRLESPNAAPMALLQSKIEELKETSGNRDFSQGSTMGGVTAASAIAALQEAGSKLSRDMLRTSYRALREMSLLCIELVRQFYEQPRTFRILGQTGEPAFETVGNAGLRAQKRKATGGYRVPEFDVSIRAQRSNPFTRSAQNELAKEFFRLGFFRPEMAMQALSTLEMMEFEGKQSVMARIRAHGGGGA